VADRDLDWVFEEYATACKQRAEIAALAIQREPLQQALQERMELEKAAAEAAGLRNKARANLKVAARAAGVTAQDEQGLAEGLVMWQEERRQLLEQHEKALKQWAELQTLLGGTTVEDLQQYAEREARRAQDLAKGMDSNELAGVQLEGDGSAHLDTLRAQVNQARHQADQLSGMVGADAARLPSVAEAEEDLSAARTELERVRGLQRTLDLTLQFLGDAQDRVHRDIAPVLATTVRRWLPDLTADRYMDAAVDPATLEVSVKSASGRWRGARLLSQGTREQIYLLLRVALAERLTRPGEVTPLILDDVTVQCDAKRTKKLLEILKEVSRQRQVILFSQEEDVREWTEASVDNFIDRLVILDPSAIPA
jgi:DNA repair protein SbcC/Rad50